MVASKTINTKIQKIHNNQKRKQKKTNNMHYNLSADSQPKSVGLVQGLAATWRSVCIHQMNRVNSRNDYVMMTAP